MAKRPPYLLPETVRPVKYTLVIKPDLSTLRFKGLAYIDILVNNTVTDIMLHATDLGIKSATLFQQGYPAVWFSHGQREGITLSENTLKLISTEPIQPGPARLIFTYTGKITDQMRGMYRSTYKLPDGQSRIMAATQFEAIDARRVFPCWDEPDAKAIFEITLIVPLHLTALSCMPVAHESQAGDGLKKVRFMPTPKMSTYLVAMAVGEFEHVEMTSGRGTKIRVYATPGKLDLCRYALHEQKDVLEFYEWYFGTPFPLPKYDLLAVPDFAAGAMENWGLNTYRETAVLVDPKNSSLDRYERVAQVVDHETAHQWFGNFVTMTGYSCIWLNEGFATWMELIAAERLHSEWRPQDLFLAGHYLNALHADALQNSRPVHIEIEREDQIDELFDPITYSKGASVIRMYEQFLGSDTFRLGVGRYLRNHAYGNADPEDLWRALETESRRSVTTMFDKWVRQAGYPKVSAIRTDSSLLQLHQERFLLEPLKAGSQDDSLWDIPTGISTTSSYPNKKYITFGERDRVVDLTTLGIPYASGDWVKLNAGHTGFFLVRYEDSDLLGFAEWIRNKRFASADRLMFAADTYLLMLGGQFPADSFLEFLKSYKEEDDRVVWQVLLPRLSRMRLTFAGEPFLPSFDEYSRNLLTSIAGLLGWDEHKNDNHHLKLLRPMVLNALGGAGDEATISEAQERFARYRTNPDSLNPNIRAAVYNIAACAGGANTHGAMITLYERATLQEEQLKLLGALGSFSNQELLRQSLDFYLSGRVRAQDVFIALRSVSANPAGLDLLWRFTKDRWHDLQNMYKEGKLLSHTISAVCSSLSTTADEEDVRRFFEEHPVPDAERTIAQARESIRIRARMCEVNRDKLMRYFSR